MRGRILTTAAALAILVGSLAPAGASPIPNAPDVPVLAGTTVLTGHRNGHLRIRVPRGATIDLTPTADASGALRPAALRTSGGRGHVGFLLTDPYTPDGSYVLAARLPRALHDGSQTIRGVGHGQIVHTVSNETEGCVRCTVPAGVYDLHLLTNRRAAKVVLTVDGLSDRTHLEPSAPTTTYGFGASLFPRGDRTHEDPALAEGGGWGIGVQWYERGSGFMLSTYEMTLLPSLVSAPAGTVDVCRTVRRTTECDDRRLVAGQGSSVAGSGVVSGVSTKSMETILEWNLYGFAEYNSRLSVLWIQMPDRYPSAPAAPTGGSAPAPAAKPWQWMKLGS